jgi:acetoin utilization protein AcuB
MLTKQLIDTSIPRLQLDDSVSKALQLLNDFHLSHLPVVANEAFLGLISESDLLDAIDTKLTIETLQQFFINAFVPDNVHFLNAVNTSIQFDTSLVPVVSNGNEYEGSITVSRLLNYLGNFTGAGEIGGIIVLEIQRSQFAISEISRIVESNNCTILHLNTTTDAFTGMLTVTIHTNKREIDSVIASFERYDYTVLYSFGNEKQSEEIDTNYRNLMSYLSI